METKTTTFEHASAMPAATWHFLKMNDTVIEIPEGLAITPDVKADVPWQARGKEDEFENALAFAQEEWEKHHPEPTAEEIAEREAFLAAEADATYGGTAQSRYQMNADAVEETRSLLVAFEHGTGDETAAYLRYAAGDRIAIIAYPRQEVDAEVVVTAVPGALSAAAIDVIADSGSTVNLSIVVEDGATQAEAPDSDATQAEALENGLAGITGTTVRVFADADAEVNITRMQAICGPFADIDDMGLFANDRARIVVRQTVLGADTTHTGLAGDLRGDSARVDVDTRYLGRGTQVHDFNYSLRHHGTRTECNLNANGVLAGTSRKTLRGTIDLIRGAKGAQGSENETVLLVDEGVRNKTVPVILCNEDDVAGNHGATIGHIREEQLFYLASRGLSQEVAERMFVSAVLEQAAIDAPCTAARAGVLRLGEKLSPGFTSLFEDE